VKYDARNPGNSMVIAEGWIGLRNKMKSWDGALGVAARPGRSRDRLIKFWWHGLEPCPFKALPKATTLVAAYALVMASGRWRGF